MNIIKYLFLTLLLFTAKVSSTDSIEEIIPKFFQYAEKSMKAWGAPGLGIVIVHKGKVVGQQVLGKRSIDSPEIINPQTAFSLASVSKTFLALLFSKLVEEKIISWDTPVRKFIPDFFIGNEKISEEFRVIDLMTHSSGLPHFAGDSFFSLGLGAEQITKNLSQIPLKALPRTQYGYQNQLFGIANLIAEKVTKKTTQQLYKDYFFTPLAMKNSFVGEKNDLDTNTSWLKKILYYFSFNKKQNISVPHTIIEGKITAFTFPDFMYTFKGSTGVYSSIEDLSKYLIALTSKKNPLISQERFEKITAPSISITNIKPTDLQFPPSRITDPAYGVGWFLWKYGTEKKRVKMISHMGAFAGVRSLISLIPEWELGIAIVSNFGSIRISLLPEALRNEFLDTLLSLKEKDWSQHMLKAMEKQREIFEKKFQENYNATPSPLRKNKKYYTGTYKNDLYGTFQIILKEEKLWLIMKDKTIPLSHLNDELFTFDPSKLSFGYSSLDKGILGFFDNEQGELSIFINVLNEGPDPSFKKIKGKKG